MCSKFYGGFAKLCEEDGFIVSSVSPFEVVEVLVFEGSGDVIVVPEALDGPSEVNTNTDGSSANEGSDWHCPHTEEIGSSASVP